MGIIPTRPEAAAADGVIDAIADIEVKRRETEKDAGLAMSCSTSLHRLHELHDHEKEALRLRGPDSEHQQNVQAVLVEIERVKKLGSVTSRRPNEKSPYPEQRKPSWRNAPQGSGRNKGRRTMGRASGR